MSARRQVSSAASPSAAACPPDYPEGLAGEVAMDLGVVHVRPIRRDDADALIAFHERLSRESQYLRFFNVHPHLLPAEVQRLTEVDYHDRLALVGEVDGELIAVGRYDRMDGSAEAEVAFVVADTYQCHGVGGMLLRRLSEAAADRGITRFVAVTLPENRRMQAVFRESGFDVHSEYDHGVVMITFPITAAKR